ncbi:hypothetical protein GPJ56_009307 [Histomonas meleagridis]|uniref:uncharacterized protein n=1 Tax=Histomonas meleagridis TaxID=135588 RepID=UPI00355A6A67|nr:hypothetical protein GPJ56_009307 [Histomonas meleagridis]KAH0797720.1 hypothetical protein GO595_009349 [Histomonas meleagridis]
MEKKIHFVSWKKHKAEQALIQVDSVLESLVSDLIFETIIDYYRKRYGYPNALPVQKILQNEPVIPEPPDKRPPFKLETTDARRFQRCPVCGEQIDAPRFTAHLEERCFKNSPGKLEIIARYFENSNAQ